MNKKSDNPIVEIIGRDLFMWLSAEFTRDTRLADLPDEILDRIGDVNVTIRDYIRDKNAITAIALITFAYNMAEKEQQAMYGSNDILLVKALVKNEKARRLGKPVSESELWNAPLYDIITGAVGDKIRSTAFMTNPSQP